LVPDEGVRLVAFTPRDAAAAIVDLFGRGITNVSIERAYARHVDDAIKEVRSDLSYREYPRIMEDVVGVTFTSEAGAEVKPGAVTTSNEELLDELVGAVRNGATEATVVYRGDDADAGQMSVLESTIGRALEGLEVDGEALDAVEALAAGNKPPQRSASVN
jgi:hypothetical protein